MRKFLLSIFCMMLLAVAAKADQLVVTFGTATYSGLIETKVKLETVTPGTDIAINDVCVFNWTKKNNSTTNVSTNLLRWYANDILNVTPAAGVTITALRIKCSTQSYGNVATTVNSGEITKGNTDGEPKYVKTWTGSVTEANPLTITPSAQIRVSYIEIDYTVSEQTGPAIPTISMGEANTVVLEQKEGADIYYTTDGVTDPTNASTKYTAPFAITGPTTVKAVAYANGLYSAVNTKALNLNQVDDIAKFLEIKNTDDVKINAPLTTVYQCGRNLYLTDGKDFILAYNSNNNEAVSNLAAVNGDVLSFISGTYKDQNGLPELIPSAVGEKTAGGTPVQPEVLSIEEIGTDMLNKYVKITGVTITALGTANNYNANDGASDITIYNSFYNATYYPGAITLPDGTKGNTIPEGEGFTLVGFVSCYGSKLQITPVEITGGKVMETVATPVFNPASGELSEGDKITISCETEGATIYYTTDGSTPEVGGNMTDEYTGEITFSDAMTVKAIAVKEGMLDSDVATATYTLKIAGQLTATFDFGTEGNIASLTTVAIQPSNTQTDTGANNMKDIPFTNGPIEMMFTTVDGGTTPRWWKTATTPNQLRIYKKNVITFRVIQDGYKIEKVQFDRGTTVSATNFAKIKIETTATNVEDAAGTWDETNKTWTATSGSVINMVALSTSTTQETAQLNGFTVVYVADDSAVAGLEGVDADNSDAPVEYYNLQGVRVAADNLTPGIYVCRQGSKVSKVLVK